MLAETPNDHPGTIPGTSPGDGQLAGRVALVTGASGGLGSALVQALASRGATVIAADVNVDGLNHVDPCSSPRVFPLRLNLAEPLEIVAAVEMIARQHGEVDILVHAAIRHFAGDDGREARLYVDHSVEQVLETLAVSVTGPTLLTQLVCQGMVRRRSGCVVFTGSMHRSGTPGIVMYSAAKAYINTLARGLFLELRDHNVKTLVANPGGMHTGLHGYRYPWMLDPAVVAETIVNQMTLPHGVAVLSFEIVPHDPEHPDSI